MAESKKKDGFSLRNSQSMSQIAVAIALMSVIPMLSIFALSVQTGRAVLPEKLGVISLITMLVAMLLGAIGGYMILMRQENSILRLSNLIRKLEKGEAPSKADLAATTEDFRMIENGMNMVLCQFSSDAAKIYTRASLISKILNEYNNTLQSISFVASLGLLDEPEPGERAQQRFREVQSTILCGRKKIDALLEECDLNLLHSRNAGKEKAVNLKPAIK